MRKSLLGLAALATVSAASAQSSVALYGTIDIGYGSHGVDSRDGARTIRSSGVMEGANSGNRIGFRGTEDLGGGMKAEFVIEQGISPTSSELFGVRSSTGQQFAVTSPFGGSNLTGSRSAFSTSTNRQSYLGVTSGVGTFNIGYQYTNAYVLGTASGYSIGSENIPGAYSSHQYGNDLVGGTRANGLTYISPRFSGFTVRAQYGAAGAAPETAVVTNGGVTTVEATGRRFGLMGQYANGPLSAALAYTSLKSTTVGSGNFAAPAANANTNSRNGNLTQLGASYDFGVVKLSGTYNTGKSGGTANSAVSSRIRAYQVGLSAPFGAFVPYITVGKAYTQLDGAAARSADLSQMQLGVRYSLSKRTTAYAMYGQTTDGAATVANQFAYRERKTVVGIAHSF
ncbi:MAG: porin [Pseudomonadota bacterium]